MGNAKRGRVQFPRCWTFQSQAERRDRGQTEESWLLFEGIDTFLYDLMRKSKIEIKMAQRTNLSKKKGAASPEAAECAFCGAREGHQGAALSKCTRCKVTSYCSKPCQLAHWRGGHKVQCVRPEERTPQAVCTDKPSTDDPKLGDEDECPICLELLLGRASACTLPCSHTFHRSCVEGLRSYGIKQVCPMCRKELPPGPDQLFEEACRAYVPMEARVERGEASWGSLTAAQQREMNEVQSLSSVKHRRR